MQGKGRGSFNQMPNPQAFFLTARQEKGVQGRKKRIWGKNEKNERFMAISGKRADVKHRRRGYQSKR